MSKTKCSAIGTGSISIKEVKNMLGRLRKNNLIVREVKLHLAKIREKGERHPANIVPSLEKIRIPEKTSWSDGLVKRTVLKPRTTQKKKKGSTAYAHTKRPAHQGEEGTVIDCVQGQEKKNNSTN